MTLPFDLADYYYAHRGLWTDDGPPENSLAAFEAAARQGYGIELDLRLTGDGRIVCFHDLSLRRMTSSAADVDQVSLEYLQALRLLDSDEHIPSLEDVLDLWPVDLPALFELKTTSGAAQKLAQSVEKIVSAQDRLATIMSFDVEAVSALSNNVARGCLIDARNATSDTDFISKVRLGRDALNVDYFSIWHTDAEFARTTAGLAPDDLVIWTVKTEEECRNALPFCQAQIFEGFDPRRIASKASTDMS